MQMLVPESFEALTAISHQCVAEGQLDGRFTEDDVSEDG